MRFLRRFTVCLLALCLLTSSALAAKATPTPAPAPVAQEKLEPPEIIQNVLDIAYREWEELDGKAIKSVNKFTEWRGKGYSFGWCGGYVTWCMLEAGVPMASREAIRKAAKANETGLYPAEGVFHVEEAGVGKLLEGYLYMGRTTNVPQPGFLLVYGCSYNKVIHVALVYDVEVLGDGRFRITTLEGNMANRVKMYIHDYDMNAEVNTRKTKSTNLTAVPEEERTHLESDAVSYALVSAKPSSSANAKYAYYVNCFLMPWVPGDAQNAATTPTPPPEK